MTHPRSEITTPYRARALARMLREVHDESKPGRGTELEYAYSPTTLSIGFRNAADESYRIASQYDPRYDRAETVTDWVSVGYACVPEFGSNFPEARTRAPGSCAQGVTPPGTQAADESVDAEMERTEQPAMAG